MTAKRRSVNNVFWRVVAGQIRRGRGLARMRSVLDNTDVQCRHYLLHVRLICAIKFYLLTYLLTYSTFMDVTYHVPALRSALAG